jgi:hypothetical protein
MGGYPQGNMPPVGLGEMNQLTRPKDIDTSFWLWIGAIVLNLVGTAFSLLLPADEKTLEATRAQFVLRGQSASDANVAAAILAGKIFVAVIVAIIIVLRLLFIFKMRQGKNWARITLTVLAALGILLTLFGISGAPIVSMILSVLMSLLVAAAVVFMFRPLPNAYFNAVKRAG